GTNGHYSFSIRDSQSLIGAFIYADDARRLTTLPEDGQVFIFRGRVDYWAQYGTLRFIVDQVEFDDIGKLRAQLEELKRRLEAEGAFAAERKHRARRASDPRFQAARGHSARPHLRPHRGGPGGRRRVPHADGGGCARGAQEVGSRGTAA